MGFFMRDRRLIGIDLENGFTYLGLTTASADDSVIILDNFVVVNTGSVGKIATTYDIYGGNRSSGTLRIDWRPGLAMRLTD
jgi:hypothetical protein